MSKLILFLTISLAAACWLPTAPAEAGGNSNNCQWKLSQTLDQMGNFDVYITHDAVKAVNLDWGYAVQARAPEWTVHVYRPKTKTEWVGALKDFCGPMINSPFEQAGANTEHNIAVGQGVMKGLRYTRFSPSKQSMNAIYGAEEISVSPQASNFIARLFDFPDQGKVPIYRCRYLSHRRQKSESWISTDAYGDQRSGLVIEFVTKAWSKQPFKASDFEMPAGYQRLNRLSDVGLSARQRKRLSDVMGAYEDDDVTESDSAAKKRPAQKH